MADGIAHGETDPSVGELHEVVPVAAHVGAGRRSHIPHGSGETRKVGETGGKQGVLECDGEGVLLLVEAGVLDGEPNPPSEVGGHGKVCFVEAPI